MEKNIKMKDIKELGEQLGELQRVCREKKIPVMIAFEVMEQQEKASDW